MLSSNEQAKGDPTLTGLATRIIEADSKRFDWLEDYKNPVQSIKPNLFRGVAVRLSMSAAAAGLLIGAAFATHHHEAASAVLDRAIPTTTVPVISPEKTTTTTPPVKTTTTTAPAPPPTTTTTSTTLPPKPTNNPNTQAAPVAAGSLGTDISWPNCGITKGLLQQAIQPSFGVVGITHGQNFAPNTCAGSEAQLFSAPWVYVNSGYPGETAASGYRSSPQNCASTDPYCIAYDYGYNAGEYSVNQANSEGLASSTIWWLDVEVGNSWDGNYLENQNSLEGEIQGIETSHKQTDGTDVLIGFYSTPAMWSEITRGWQNGYPNWVATGPGTVNQALPDCVGHSFTGGKTVAVQAVNELLNVDLDLMCP